MATLRYAVNGLTGGTTGKLDDYLHSIFATGDITISIDSEKIYAHIFDSTRTDAENSPLIVRPDDYSGSGVHVMCSSPFGDLQIQPEIVSGLPIEGGITGGDITRTGVTELTITPCTCLNSALAAKLYTSTNLTITAPTGSSWAANTVYHIFIVRLLAGTFEFRAYLTEAAAAADAAINAYRWLDYWVTNGSSQLREGVTRNGVKTWSRFSENTINTSTAPPANITTAISLASHLPATRVAEVLIGGIASSAVCTVAVSGVSGTAQSAFNCEYRDVGSGGLNEWGSTRGSFIPLITDSIYWGDGTSSTTGNVQLAIHAAKVRR